MLNYRPSITGDRFLKSRAFNKLIMGPVGGGKSTVALMDLVDRAVNQAPFNNTRRTKFIILRNTIAQLKATVKPLIDTWFVTMTKGTMGQWRLSDNVFEAKFRLPDGTIVHSEFVLMAADTPDDVRRLLSLEASAAWVEECREVDPEVFAGLQGRVNRFPSKIAGGVTYPGVICSTNPPPTGGFWHKFIVTEEKGKEIFIQPPALLDDGSLNPDAENLENLADDYYENLVTGKTEDWINVYLKNMFGAGDLGRPIYRNTFKPSFHVATKPLSAVMQSLNPLVIGMDNGLQAAAAIGQRDMRGRINILAESYVPEDETMGVETFLRTLLVPMLRTKFPTFKPENIMFELDPACFQRSQLDEKTIAQAVAAYGYRVNKASTNDPERRIQAVEQLLSQQIDGGAGFLIDASCSHIIDTLTWGHRYKRSPSGVPSTTADKTHHSHCFVAGTMVATPDGPVAIENLTCDHRVLTPNGACDVVAVMSHVSSDLMRLDFSDGTSVTCTGDHPFFTERGIVLANMLEYTDVLFSIGENSWQKPNTQSKHSSGSSITASQPATSSLTTSVTAGSTCTVLSGSTTTEKSQLGTTYTTETETNRTTGSKTWSVSMRQTMCVATVWIAIQLQKVSRLRCAPWSWPDRQQPNGTGLTKVSAGTQKTQSAHGSHASESSCSATTAQSHIWGSLKWSNRGTAHQRAKQAPASSLVSTTKHAAVQSAAQNSESTSTGKPEHAVKLVGKQHLVGQSAKVYDLTVLDEHCFYANGILVSNCGDAVQYLALRFASPRDDWAAMTKKRAVVRSTYRYV